MWSQRNRERLGSLESSSEDCRGGARCRSPPLLRHPRPTLLLYFYDESDFAARALGFSFRTERQNGSSDRFFLFKFRSCLKDEVFFVKFLTFECFVNRGSFCDSHTLVINKYWISQWFEYKNNINQEQSTKHFTYKSDSNVSSDMYYELRISQRSR